MLVGKPLAVVRAALRLELAGRPATRTAWSATGKEDTGGVSGSASPSSSA